MLVDGKGRRHFGSVSPLVTMKDETPVLKVDYDSGDDNAKYRRRWPCHKVEGLAWAFEAYKREGKGEAPMERSISLEDVDDDGGDGVVEDVNRVEDHPPVPPKNSKDEQRRAQSKASEKQGGKEEEDDSEGKGDFVERRDKEKGKHKQQGGQKRKSCTLGDLLPKNNVVGGSSFVAGGEEEEEEGARRAAAASFRLPNLLRSQRRQFRALRVADLRSRRRLK